MRSLSKKSRAAIAGAVVVAFTGGGLAYGYWSTSGNGTGSATTSSGAASLTITQTSAPSDLAPGMAAGSIAGTVRNTAGHKAYVHQVTVSISSITKATNAVGTCTVDDYTLSNPTMTVDTEVAANGTVDFSGATLGFNDRDANQDGCKGAAVQLAYLAN